MITAKISFLYQFILYIYVYLLSLNKIPKMVEIESFHMIVYGAPLSYWDKGMDT